MQDLRAAVEANNDVLTVSMEEVRNAHGAQRLGRVVRENISKALSSHGLEHHPAELPDRYWDKVRLYKMGSPASALITAVLAPGDAADHAIRNALSGADTEILDRIRELVCG
jgi:hypothetical protein